MTAATATENVLIHLMEENVGLVNSSGMEVDFIPAG
jgi:hypothetical protein